MSRVQAQLVHQLPGRVRLRVPAARGHADFMETVRAQLLACPSVREVNVSSATGSVLIRHDGDWSDVMRFAEERSLFDMRAETGSRDPLPLVGIADAFQDLDQRLRARSEDRWGLGSLSFYGLLGATAYQIVQGRILPPAGTLVFQALTVFLRTLGTDRKRT